MLWIVYYYVLAMVAATPFTFQLKASETSCWYVSTDRPNTEISFYYTVQSGGSFDVDYVVKRPDGHVQYSKNKEAQSEFTFNANQVGEWEFCFSNGMSSYADKIIDFEIKADGESGPQYRAQMPVSPNTKPMAHVSTMQQTVDEIENQLDQLTKQLRYYKVRNARNQATVRSTESRIFYFSVFEVLLMVGMAALQIAIVQLFFKGSRKQLV
ncbi:hypothetical protein DIURU_003683 [Diutina rugosa]|uniref:GOLD domain-containing protein n=1 Tax=Diutina rugosa TaxID=5481 RepID=A0A642UKK5_DIURU|nr:uncharacterized protein DIURU_003683 [Diutina rugosa]KAA8900701.1 hypothetical protein DIURU_003683 [Diutina rugosa]